MNDNEFNASTDKIYYIFFGKENQTKSNDEIKNLIKHVLLDNYTDGVRVGRHQILNNIEAACADLRGKLEQFERE